jgi:hypothetical protein
MSSTFDQLALFLYDQRREKARGMRRAGCTIAQIKAALGFESDYAALSLVADIPPPNPKFRSRAKDEVKARARELRLLGWTYPQISTELGVSKSSCSLWCSDLPRPLRFPRPPHRPDWESFRQRRQRERMLTKYTAAREIGMVTARDLFLIGVVLYWAEGGKDKPYDRRELLKFSNSDPDVVRTYMAWLDLLGVEPDRFRFRVQIHESADPEAAVRYWSDVVGASPERFGKTTLKRHNPKTNRKNRGAGYHGCLAIEILQSARLYQRVEGWWHGIRAGVTSLEASSDGTMVSNHPGSSKGRTEIFGVSNRGSNPLPGAESVETRSLSSSANILGVTPASPPRRPREPGAPNP